MEDDVDDWKLDEDDATVAEDNIYDGLFGLVLNDKPVIDRLIDCVRKVIARPDVTAQQIHDLALLLFALQRLPALTYIILDPSAGGDSMATTVFEAEVGGYRAFDSPWGVAGWLDDFEAACGELEQEVDVTNYSDATPDWLVEPEPQLWAGLDFDGGWSQP